MIDNLSVIIKISLIFNNLWKSVIICGQKKSVDKIICDNLWIKKSVDKS